ncbi:unnamed protein product [Linum trigynum]|uniref:Uncharacterized protein n=1 Tax=Linum trigynum TaxID=586398 RepID=A0AAV2EPR2_9ROSI
MGCCTDKCKPRKPNFATAAEEFRHVQDKLVVSQQPPIARTPPIFHYHHHPSNKNSPIFLLLLLPLLLPFRFLHSAAASVAEASTPLLPPTIVVGVIYLNSFKDCANKLPESPVPILKQGKRQSVKGCSIATPQLSK